MVRRRLLALTTIAMSATALSTAGLDAAAATPSSAKVESSPRGTVLPTGQMLTPAGRSVTITDGPGLNGPWAVSLTPDGRHALVTSSGAAVQDQTVEMFDTRDGSRDDVEIYDGANGESVFYGLAFSPNGSQAWAAGAGQGVVHSYAVGRNGQLTPGEDIPAGNFPTGLAYGTTPSGPRLYAVDNLGDAPAPGGYEDPPGHSVTVIDPRTGAATGSIDLGEALFPYGVTFDRTGRKAYVTNWTGRSVSVIDTARERVARTITLSTIDNPLSADHPTAVVANPKTSEVYVANTNSDTVSVIDSRRDTVVATIDVALVPGGPKGSMPEGLAVSPDGRTLFVAESGENAVAVVDLKRRTVRGFIPTGASPAGVAVTPDARTLVVVNTNGNGAGPNPCGTLSPIFSSCPDGPLYSDGVLETQYTGTMTRGSLQLIGLSRYDDDLDEQLSKWTTQVRRNNLVTADRRTRPRALSAITHVIYVIKENRTYDQVFGDLPKGNGAPELTVFGALSAPNHRALAEDFVLLDNFYVDAEVSQDGHPWSIQGVATDYVEKTWPFQYSYAFSRAYSSEFVPLEQQFASEPLASDPTVPRSASTATAGFLWDRAYDRGVSFRVYGEGTPWDSPDCADAVEYSDLTRLHARFGEHVAPSFPGWDMSCPDHTARIAAWEAEFRGYEASGDLPGLEIVYLPNDHTQGTSAGEATPESYMADNDVALGRLVDVVSHSRFWGSTAIITVEDDAQDGADHIDAHRSPSLVISPYTQHGRVDSTHYDTASALATTEQLLGLAPMSIFDARATPMWAAFDRRPDLTPYTVRTPEVIPFGDPGYPVNPPDAPLAAQSAAQDFSVPDGPDERVLNRAIWESAHGAGTPVPDSAATVADAAPEEG